jgi:uncharacterized protein YndB with AHSA1/START domain
MELRFTVRAHISRPVATVFEAVVDPDQLSGYFTTGGATGRLAKGATVTWDFHDFPGAFPVEVVDVVSNTRVVLRWAAQAPAIDGHTEVTIGFEPVGADRTLVTVTEEGWQPGPEGLAASYGNCMGWSQMLAAMKAYVEYGINLREGMYV